MKPFQVHTALMGQYETFLGGGDPKGQATLTIFGIVIPVTHTEIVTDFEVMAGLSAKTFVERCEFRVSMVGANAVNVVKGVLCTLIPIPGGPPFAMQLYHGGLQPGAEIFRWMLVDQNYRA